MTAESLVTSDPKVLNGTPVFKGTRVPVRTLFEYLADGLSLEYFLESFPSVTREQAADVIRLGQERVDTQYGVTENELDRFVKRMNRRIAQERKKGTIKKYSGNLEADLAD